MEDLKGTVLENACKINEIQVELARQDSTIQLMQKDYEYMKKTLDNIENNSNVNFNTINQKLDDMNKKSLEAQKERLENLDDIKKHVVKAIILAFVMAGVVYLFPFVQ